MISASYCDGELCQLHYFTLLLKEVEVLGALGTPITNIFSLGTIWTAVSYLESLVFCKLRMASENWASFLLYSSLPYLFSSDLSWNELKVQISGLLPCPARKSPSWATQPALCCGTDVRGAVPVTCLQTACCAAELKEFLEDPANFDTLSLVFNR